jgi:hypothetical protein
VCFNGIIGIDLCPLGDAPSTATSAAPDILTPQQLFFLRKKILWVFAFPMDPLCHQVLLSYPLYLRSVPMRRKCMSVRCKFQVSDFCKFVRPTWENAKYPYQINAAQPETLICARLPFNIEMLP